MNLTNDLPTLLANFALYGRVVVANQGTASTPLFYLRHHDPNIVYPFHNYFGGTYLTSRRVSTWKIKGKAAEKAAKSLLIGNFPALHLLTIYNTIVPFFNVTQYNEVRHNLEAIRWEQFSKRFPSAPVPHDIPRRVDLSAIEAEDPAAKEMQDLYGDKDHWLKKNIPASKRGKRYQ